MPLLIAGALIVKSNSLLVSSNEAQSTIQETNENIPFPELSQYSKEFNRANQYTLLTIKGAGTSSTKDICGSFNSVKFNHVRVKANNLSKYTVQTPSNGTFIPLHVATLRLKAESGSIDESYRVLKIKNAFDLLRANEIHSPFVQHYLGYRDLVKVSEKAESDLEIAIDNYKIDSNYPHRDLFQRNFKKIIGQMLLSVNALHAKKLVHRDIKPANYLMKIHDNNSIHIQLADLDDVVSTDQLETIFEIAGTPITQDPRVTEIQKAIENGEYTPEIGLEKYKALDLKTVDCCALGKTIARLTKAILTNTTASSEYIDLCQNLTNENLELRYTIEQAMNDPCFGSSKAEREAFFTTLEEDYTVESYYDGYYQSASNFYPEKNDNFFLLPLSMKSIYCEYENLMSKAHFLTILNEETNSVNIQLSLNVMEERAQFLIDQAKSFIENKDYYYINTQNKITLTSLMQDLDIFKNRITELKNQNAKQLLQYLVNEIQNDITSLSAANININKISIETSITNLSMTLEKLIGSQNFKNNYPTSIIEEAITDLTLAYSKKLNSIHPIKKYKDSSEVQKWNTPPRSSCENISFNKIKNLFFNMNKRCSTVKGTESDNDHSATLKCSIPL